MLLAAADAPAGTGDMVVMADAEMAAAGQAGPHTGDVLMSDQDAAHNPTSAHVVEAAVIPAMTVVGAAKQTDATAVGGCDQAGAVEMPGMSVVAQDAMIK